MEQQSTQPLPQNPLILKSRQFLSDISMKKQAVLPTVLHPNILQLGAAYIQDLNAYASGCETTHFEIQYYTDTMCIVKSGNSDEKAAPLPKTTMIWKMYQGEWKLFHIHCSDTPVPAVWSDRR